MRAKIFVGAALALAVVLGGYACYTHAARQQADVFYFKMAPVDPRALLSGDYMELFYEVETGSRGENKGSVVLYVAQNGVVQTEKTDRPLVVPTFERRLRLPHQFYFQEGTGEKYENAAYAKMLRLPNGRFLIQALTDEKLNEIN